MAERRRRRRPRRPGADAVLIGTALSAAADPATLLARLSRGHRHAPMAGGQDLRPHAARGCGDGGGPGRPTWASFLLGVPGSQPVRAPRSCARRPPGSPFSASSATSRVEEILRIGASRRARSGAQLHGPYAARRAARLRGRGAAGLAGRADRQRRPISTVWAKRPATPTPCWWSRGSPRGGRSRRSARPGRGPRGPSAAGGLDDGAGRRTHARRPSAKPWPSFDPRWWM